jgi:uncharacterized membrane protein
MSMGKGRLEAFSDGVIAIIITIMVLELRAPEGAAFADLRGAAPTFLSYVLSFIYVGIYWNNHHHLMKAAGSVTARVMWANLHLLFWLSMVPFATSWMGEHPRAPAPTALYGGVLILCAAAYTILTRVMVRHEGPDSTVAAALGGRLSRDWKGNASLALYAAGVALAFLEPLAAKAVYVFVAAMWFVPDRRVERALKARHAA